MLQERAGGSLNQSAARSVRSLAEKFQGFDFDRQDNRIYRAQPRLLGVLSLSCREEIQDITATERQIEMERRCASISSVGPGSFPGEPSAQIDPGVHGPVARRAWCLRPGHGPRRVWGTGLGMFCLCPVGCRAQDSESDINS